MLEKFLKHSLASFTVKFRDIDPASFSTVQLYSPTSVPSDNRTSSIELVRGAPWPSLELGGSVQVVLGDGAPAAVQSSNTESPILTTTSTPTSGSTNCGDSVQRESREEKVKVWLIGTHSEPLTSTYIQLLSPTQHPPTTHCHNQSRKKSKVTPFLPTK